MIEPSNIVTLTGCTTLTVTRPGDGVTAPLSETVTVRTIPIKDFPAYLSAQENELAMVALYCGKTEAWAAELDNPSIEAVLERGEEMNQDFFGRWVSRRINRQERLIPGITQMLLKNQSPLPSGLPKSPPPVASPSPKP